ncbi:DUF3014 domain-containing protein [Shewanella schlegeliana]|uniref:DUF3014 domain-containing protein n=1 Tax=Shewanella schlegeliana TaxID=190308 RepID=A0ABS1T153_9GAMM|nr:DUF3014 domain-containing protein [Shewanella schlegeliana]MBL4914505.1 DUF3014 domain-containing protein [Shewanella schlegeliana]MCL1109679.1 DUF3014 domain-containing protein [Shewanella schlegeliana]GIU33433.1 hypothetical protein TUM4433_27880 [Shewanella schlegeliana]
MQLSQEDRISPQEKSSGTNGLAILAIVAVVALSAGGYYYLSGNEEIEELQVIAPVVIPDPVPEQPLETEAVPEPEVIIEAEPVQLPEVDPVPQVEPLPALADSDEFVHQKVTNVADGMAIEPLLIEDNLVRQFVVFIDNLAQGELARKVSPLKAPNNSFTVSEIANKTYINPDSYHRYDLYADFLASLNDEELAKTYKELTPLLSEAFVELGYNDISFDERMQQAIEVMLDAPIIEQPIELDGVSVNYQFVDPKLEALPNAQKLMVRMGPENSRKVKSALRRLQKHLN